MKAIIQTNYGEAKTAFEIQEKPIPTLANDEVLIKVAVSGINFADIMARRGFYKAAPKPPAILGYEVAGTIEKIGENVKGFIVGDRVLALTRFGGYAEYATTKANVVSHLDAAISFEESTALATQFVTAWLATNWAINVLPNEKAIVLSAAGGVGLAICQYLKTKQAEVIGVVSSEEKGNWLVEKGWVDSFVLNAEYENKRTSLNATLAFNAVGGKTVRDDLKNLQAGGRVVFYGASTQLNGKPGLVTKLRTLFGFGWQNTLQLIMQSKGIIGLNALTLGDKHPEWLAFALEQVQKNVLNGTIKAHIGGVFKAEEVAQAHQFIESRKSVGKVVLTW